MSDSLSFSMLLLYPKTVLSLFFEDHCFPVKEENQSWNLWSPPDVRCNYPPKVFDKYFGRVVTSEGALLSLSTGNVLITTFSSAGCHICMCMYIFFCLPWREFSNSVGVISDSGLVELCVNCRQHQSQIKSIWQSIVFRIQYFIIFFSRFLKYILYALECSHKMRKVIKQC